METLLAHSLESYATIDVNTVSQTDFEPQPDIKPLAAVCRSSISDDLIARLF